MKVLTWTVAEPPDGLVAVLAGCRVGDRLHWRDVDDTAVSSTVTAVSGRAVWTRAGRVGVEDVVRLVWVGVDGEVS